MNVALIFAGGIGTRMKTQGMPKQFLEFEGKSILIHSIMNFEEHKEIDAIVVVCLEDYIATLQEEINNNNIKKVKWIVPGGETGQISIYHGLKKVYDEVKNPEEVIILLNDGVRPLVSDEIISRNLECVSKNGSSVTVCPVSETIVEVSEENSIYNIPVRSQCYLSKAPQGFYLSDLINAHNKAISDNRFDCTNSAELMRRYGHSLHVVYDTDENIKITTPTDIIIWKSLRRKEAGGENNAG